MLSNRKGFFKVGAATKSFGGLKSGSKKNGSIDGPWVLSSNAKTSSVDERLQQEQSTRRNDNEERDSVARTSELRQNLIGSDHIENNMASDQTINSHNADDAVLKARSVKAAEDEYFLCLWTQLLAELQLFWASTPLNNEKNTHILNRDVALSKFARAQALSAEASVFVMMAREEAHAEGGPIQAAACASADSASVSDSDDAGDSSVLPPPPPPPRDGKRPSSTESAEKTEMRNLDQDTRDVQNGNDVISQYDQVDVYDHSDDSREGIESIESASESQDDDSSYSGLSVDSPAIPSNRLKESAYLPGKDIASAYNAVQDTNAVQEAEVNTSQEAEVISNFDIVATSSYGPSSVTENLSVDEISVDTSSLQPSNQDLDKYQAKASEPSLLSEIELDDYAAAESPEDYADTDAEVVDLFPEDDEKNQEESCAKELKDHENIESPEEYAENDIAAMLPEVAEKNKDELNNEYSAEDCKDDGIDKEIEKDSELILDTAEESIPEQREIEDIPKDYEGDIVTSNEVGGNESQPKDNTDTEVETELLLHIKVDLDAEPQVVPADISDESKKEDYQQSITGKSEELTNDEQPEAHDQEELAVLVEEETLKSPRSLDWLDIDAAVIPAEDDKDYESDAAVEATSTKRSKSWFAVAANHGRKTSTRLASAAEQGTKRSSKKIKKTSKQLSIAAEQGTRSSSKKIQKIVKTASKKTKKTTKKLFNADSNGYIEDDSSSQIEKISEKVVLSEEAISTATNKKEEDEVHDGEDKTEKEDRYEIKEQDMVHQEIDTPSASEAESVQKLADFSNKVAKESGDKAKKFLNKAMIGGGRSEIEGALLQLADASEFETNAALITKEANSHKSQLNTCFAEDKESVMLDTVQKLIAEQDAKLREADSAKKLADMSYKQAAASELVARKLVEEAVRIGDREEIEKALQELADSKLMEMKAAEMMKEAHRCFEESKFAAQEAAAQKLAAEKVAAEKAAKEQRIATEKAKQERLEQERLEQERLEAERLAVEKAKQERLELERLAEEQRIATDVAVSSPAGTAFESTNVPLSLPWESIEMTVAGLAIDPTKGSLEKLQSIISLMENPPSSEHVVSSLLNPMPSPEPPTMSMLPNEFALVPSNESSSAPKYSALDHQMVSPEPTISVSSNEPSSAPTYSPFKNEMTSSEPKISVPSNEISSVLPSYSPSEEKIKMLEAKLLQMKKVMEQVDKLVDKQQQLETQRREHDKEREARLQEEAQMKVVEQNKALEAKLLKMEKVKELEDKLQQLETQKKKVAEQKKQNKELEAKLQQLASRGPIEELTEEFEIKVQHPETQELLAEQNKEFEATLQQREIQRSDAEEHNEIEKKKQMDAQRHEEEVRRHEEEVQRHEEEMQRILAEYEEYDIQTEYTGDDILSSDEDMSLRNALSDESDTPKVAFELKLGPYSTGVDFKDYFR